MGDDPVVELNVRGSLLKFTDLKRSSSPIGDVQAFALAGRREEHLVVRFPTDRLGKARFQIDGDHPGVEVAGTEIFDPVLRRLYAVGSKPLRTGLDCGAEHTGAEQIAGNVDRALSAE